MPSPAEPTDGFYLALDRYWRDPQKNRFEWEADRNRVEGLEWLSPRYEHFYWHGEKRTWFGAVEDAMSYPTKEEAEGQAVFAMALDADVAGHMHIVSRREAFKREEFNIERRTHEKKAREQHDKMRFKLGPGEVWL